MKMDLKTVEYGLGFLVILTLFGPTNGAQCTEEVECVGTRIWSPFILQLLFGEDFGIPIKYKYACNKTKCCAGYEGEDCSQLTTDCVQNGNCLGHKDVEEYTDGCLCKQEETMDGKFMGRNKRMVNVPCETPCKRTGCCAGYTGTECNEKYDQDSSFLTPTQLNNIKDQLKIDEGYRDHIYFDSEGLETFGIGHLVRVSDPEDGQPINTPVSETRIQEAFEADLHIATQDVLKIFPQAGGFPGEVKEILVNMSFNLGGPGLKKFRKFIAAVNKSDWSTAADEMEDSKWYRQVKGRAERLVERMRAVANE